MSSRDDFNHSFRLIVECLDRHHVSYVVIGGVAAMLQDVPTIETYDVDIAPERERKNLRALARALIEMEARLRIANDEEGVQIPLDERTFAGVSTMTFTTRFGPFDILFEPSGAPAYAELRSHAEVLKRFGLEIPEARFMDTRSSADATGISSRRSGSSVSAGAELRYRFLDALGQHREVGGRIEVAQDPEPDNTVV